MAKKKYDSMSEDELWQEMQRIQAAKAKLDAEQEQVRAEFDARVSTKRVDDLLAGLSDVEIQAVAARIGGGD